MDRALNHARTRNGRLEKRMAFVLLAKFMWHHACILLMSTQYSRLPCDTASPILQRQTQSSLILSLALATSIDAW